MKHLTSAKFYLSFLAQIKQHNQYSNIISNLKYEQCPHLSTNGNFEKSPINGLKVNKFSTKEEFKFQNGLEV